MCVFPYDVLGIKNFTQAKVNDLQVEMIGIFMLCRVHIVVYSDFRAGYKL
jgi:hypothetical protein